MAGEERREHNRRRKVNMGGKRIIHFFFFLQRQPRLPTYSPNDSRLIAIQFCLKNILFSLDLFIPENKKEDNLAENLKFINSTEGYIDKHPYWSTEKKNKEIFCNVLSYFSICVFTLIRKYIDIFCLFTFTL
jgi:hypothetical protein